MEGTIKIEAIPNKGLSLEMNIRHVSIVDMMAILDSLMQGFELDAADRMLMCAMLAVGKPDSTKVEFDPQMLDMLRKMREDGES